jgi:hypothetical protein
MTRRQAVFILAGAGGGAGLIFALTRLRGPSPSAVEAAFDLRSKSAWHELGKRYLAQFPTDRDPAAWDAGMSEAFEKRSGGQALRRALSDQVLRDFERGNTVDIEGWTLSRTEARLAALAALSA